VEQLLGILSNLKAELLEPLLIKGLLRDADKPALTRLAAEINLKHQHLEQE